MGFESLWLDLVDDNALGVILEGVIFVYCFAGLAAVCDKYLVVSLETLCVRWGVREDVAGATFMAFGSAAPEIIINAIGTITGESDLGVGAIIGSGMIAFSCIPGLCALVAGADLMLKRRPLARDSLFYLLALTLLTVFFSDGFITMGEAAMLFSLYVLYVGLVFASPNIRRFLQKRKRQQQYEAALKEAMSRGADRAALEELKVRYLTEQTKKSFVEQAAERNQKGAAGAAVNGSAGRGAGRGGNDLSNSLLGDGPVDAAAVDVGGGGDGLVSPRSDDEDAEYVPPSHVEEEEEEEDNTWKGKAYRAFTAPLTLAFQYTCIACEHDGPNAKWYPLTFLAAFIWVSFFSFTISAVAGRWNDLSGLPLSLFGIVLVAVGAEIPDTISSLAVARRGYGSMAISNSCGSQITNIVPAQRTQHTRRRRSPASLCRAVLTLSLALSCYQLFGLGLPWTMANVIGLAQKMVPGQDPCIAWEEEHPEEECPPFVAEQYGYDKETGMVRWQGVQVADHSDVIIAAGFQFFILLTFISTLLLLALAMRKDKATLNKRKGAILVGAYAAAVLGYMIVSRGIVKPATDAPIYPSSEE